MPQNLTPVFTHNHHRLHVQGDNLVADVLAFDGEERLSQPYRYRIEFTCVEQDIAAERLLNQEATFGLYPSPHTLPKVERWHPQPPPLQALGERHGIITGFKRLSHSLDEARYEVILEPRFALLARGKQFRLYQNQSVPQIVGSILRGRHDFDGWMFEFVLHHEYPPREQVMQHDESDLAFISRLLAEVGIWYRFNNHVDVAADILYLHDHQRFYEYDHSLPCRKPSGFASGEDGVWGLQTQHQVVEQRVSIRNYTAEDSQARLDGEVNLADAASSTYGEAYHYAEPYRARGNPHAWDDKLECESGEFFARLRHERYLNQQARLTGSSSCSKLAIGQMLTITDGVPKAFEAGAVIIGLTLSAARDRGLAVGFDAIPYLNSVCFRPPALPKPRMAGTLPARVTTTQDDPYGYLDTFGRYRVNFLFDCDEWQKGRESTWLRLARPYAGDTHGLHLPLTPGTEVAVAFEQGDPDRPYIAHALHDDKHPDPVSWINRQRNVLRTPANNKLRMDDTRGQEHVKLSSEHGGKSQLNLGHLVDATKTKRGEGFELRSDSWGAVRAGKGLFISADAQLKADGQALDMDAAIGRLKQAGEQMNQLSNDAKAANADTADVYAQMAMMRERLDQLRDAVALLSAPQGIALTSGKHLQLAAQDNVMINAGGQADISVVKRLFMGIGQGLSLFVNKLGIKLIANQGPVSVQAQNDTLEILARQGLNITSTEDEIHITADKKIVLNGGGSSLSIDHCCIEFATEGDFRIRGPNFFHHKTKLYRPPQVPPLPAAVHPPLIFSKQYQLFESCGKKVIPNCRYVITAANGQQWKGMSDSNGLTERVRTASAQQLSMEYGMEEEEEEEELSEGITLRLGLFFDGTGNNSSNSAAAQQCRREDLKLFQKDELAAVVAQCKAYGFKGYEGGEFGKTPDGSYGNAPSNVVYLRRLYPDHAVDGMPSDARIGYLPVYIEGIGTRAKGPDSWYGMGTGQGGTGVVARVIQASEEIRTKLLEFLVANPMVTVARVEFDIVGFSRGAAAARHCANELLKPDRGVFNELLRGNAFGVLASFDPAKDVGINFIGLFDTVAAIAAPVNLHFSVSDDLNPGVNLYLPPGCARKVIQLCARDESRLNFGLNSVSPDHLEISLPGVHSDVGGGYLPRAHERVILKMRRAFVNAGEQIELQSEWQNMLSEAEKIRSTGLEGDGSILLEAWPIPEPPRGGSGGRTMDYMLCILLDRPVRGELGLIALRVMREYGVLSGVPFESIDEHPDLAVPEELQSIATQVLGQALKGKAVVLNPDQERLLRGYYIHQSAHWTPTYMLMVNKPTRSGQRNIFGHRPQKGYPE